MAEAGEKLTELVASDYKLMRMLALLEALQGGVGGSSPGDFAVARRNAERMTECLFNGLKRADPAKAKRVGGHTGPARRAEGSRSAEGSRPAGGACQGPRRVRRGPTGQGIAAQGLQ